MNVHENNFLILLKQGLESTNPKESVIKLKLSLRLYNQMAKEKGWNEVYHLAEFLMLLTTIRALDFFEECEIKNAILTESFKLAPKLNEILDDVHIYEKQQEMMRDVLVKIRQDIEEIETKQYRYELIRTFISQNCLVTQLDIEKVLKRGLTHELLNDVKAMYPLYQVVKDEVTCCPVCHRIVEEEKCSEICHYYIKRKNLEFYQRKLEHKRRYFYLCEGIYRYTLMPSIGELHIFNRLKSLIKEEGEVQLYPDIDEYDIEIKLCGKIYKLDVKDYKDPMGLVQNFKAEHAASKMMSRHKIKTYVVIPNHRVDIYDKGINKSYMREVEQLFDNLLPEIKVISENKLYKIIKNKLGNEV